MLRVEVNGLLHDWFDVDEMGDFVRSAAFASTLRENIARYFGVVLEKQAIYDEDGLLTTGADFSRALQRVNPKLYVYDVTEMGTELRDRTVEELEMIDAEVEQSWRHFGARTARCRTSGGASSGFIGPDRGAEALDRNDEKGCGGCATASTCGDGSCAEGGSGGTGWAPTLQRHLATESPTSATASFPEVQPRDHRSSSVFTLDGRSCGSGAAPPRVRPAACVTNARGPGSCAAALSQQKPGSAHMPQVVSVHSDGASAFSLFAPAANTSVGSSQAAPPVEAPYTDRTCSPDRLADSQPQRLDHLRRRPSEVALGKSSTLPGAVSPSPLRLPRHAPPAAPGVRAASVVQVSPPNFMGTIGQVRMVAPGMPDGIREQQPFYHATALHAGSSSRSTTPPPSTLVSGPMPGPAGMLRGDSTRRLLYATFPQGGLERSLSPARHVTPRAATPGPARTARRSMTPVPVAVSPMSKGAMPWQVQAVQQECSRGAASRSGTPRRSQGPTQVPWQPQVSPQQPQPQQQLHSQRQVLQQQIPMPPLLQPHIQAHGQFPWQTGYASTAYPLGLHAPAPGSVVMGVMPPGQANAAGIACAAVPDAHVNLTFADASGLGSSGPP